MSTTTAITDATRLDWDLVQLERCLDVVETARQALEATGSVENEPAIGALAMAYSRGLKTVAKARKRVERLKALQEAPPAI